MLRRVAPPDRPLVVGTLQAHGQSPVEFDSRELALLGRLGARPAALLVASQQNGRQLVEHHHLVDEHKDAADAAAARSAAPAKGVPMEAGVLLLLRLLFRLTK